MGLASLVNEEQASRWKPTRTETFEGVTFKLTKDIKLTGEWTPDRNEREHLFRRLF